VDLDIWLCGRLVARTQSRDRGRRVRVTYDEAVVDQYGAEIPLLSCSLPTPGPSEQARARAFLEGLLPEGRALNTAAAQVRDVRLVDAAPETARDAVALLAEFGRECAGAVVVLPTGSAAPEAGRYQSLDEDDLDVIVRGLPQHPVGTDLGRDIRMSLAGAQPKFLLARIDGRWCEPIGGAPSTHIIKPATEWPHSAQNEALIIALGRACGLTDSAAWVEQMGDVNVFVTQRYDRRFAEDGQIERLHQEDMCQATGLRPKDKYGVGRPSERMTRLLRDNAESPRIQTAALFRQIAFRVVVGDEDGHGKNYSLILDDGAVRLAPLYDSLCTLIYPSLSGVMGAQIGNRTNLATVDRPALLDEAKAMTLTTAEAEEGLDALATSLRAAIDNLDDRFTGDWPSERVTDVVLARIDRLENGKPLGGPSPDRTRQSLNLDQATAARKSEPPV
jgi:serine/threonine-protein kinase HipA